MVRLFTVVVGSSVVVVVVVGFLPDSSPIVKKRLSKSLKKLSKVSSKLKKKMITEVYIPAISNLAFGVPKINSKSGVLLFMKKAYAFL